MVNDKGGGVIAIGLWIILCGSFIILLAGLAYKLVGFLFYTGRDITKAIGGLREKSPLEIEIDRLKKVKARNDYLNNLFLNNKTLNDKFLVLIKEKAESDFFKEELSVQSRSLLSENEKVLLKEAIESREIEYLVHFTQTSNIESIVKYGLFARNILSTLPNKCVCNDDLRLDKREDCCCVSIGFPNYSMFYKYRKNDESIKWAVIGLKKEVLIDKECFFCFTNAASSTISNFADSELRGVSAFNLLYANDEERTRQGLKKFLANRCTS